MQEERFIEETTGEQTMDYNGNKVTQLGLF